jgi:hypothetical protein
LCFVNLTRTGVKDGLLYWIASSRCSSQWLLREIAAQAAEGPAEAFIEPVDIS